MNDDVIQLEDEFLENATDVMGKYFVSVADEHTRELIHTDFTEILDGVVASGQIEGYEDYEVRYEGSDVKFEATCHTPDGNKKMYMTYGTAPAEQ